MEQALAQSLKAALHLILSPVHLSPGSSKEGVCRVTEEEQSRKGFRALFFAIPEYNNIGRK